jgi:hypothetical protein
MEQLPTVSERQGPGFRRIVEVLAADPLGINEPSGRVRWRTDTTRRFRLWHRMPFKRLQSNTYRERAAECRKLAKSARANMRDSYIKLAESYEQLAEQIDAEAPPRKTKR